MSEQEYYYAVGRRKTSVATVRLYFKKGKNAINGKSLEVLYPSAVEQKSVIEPFFVGEINPETVYFTANTKGGGAISQIGAIKLALTRAIIKKYPEKKKALKVAGLVTRDPRMVERKKPGLLKARKKEQYSKR